ncbi:unnamed protein product [Lampetra fluviatilis]
MALLLSFAKEVAEQFVHLLSHASKTAEPLGLTALSRVEMQLAKHFDSRDLPSLGLGSFLDILDHNTQAFKPAAATVSDYDVTNGSEEEESGSVESEAKSDSESEDEETSDSSGDEDCQKFALAPSTYEVEEKTDEVEGNIDEAEEKKDEVLEEVASGIVADVDGAAASEAIFDPLSNIHRRFLLIKRGDTVFRSALLALGQAAYLSTDRAALDSLALERLLVLARELGIVLTIAAANNLTSLHVARNIQAHLSLRMACSDGVH